MAKFKFGERPKTFKHTVKWKDIYGVNNELTVDFVTRSRKEFGELFDEMLADAKKTRGGLEVEDMSMTEIMESTGGNNAKYILAAVDKWDVDEDLNLENAQRFADEYAGGANALMEAYRKACLEGKLGN